MFFLTVIELGEFANEKLIEGDFNAVRELTVERVRLFMKSKNFLYLGIVIFGASLSEYIYGLIIEGIGLFLLLLSAIESDYDCSNDPDVVGPQTKKRRERFCV